jgi:adenylate cyclase
MLLAGNLLLLHQVAATSFFPQQPARGCSCSCPSSRSGAAAIITASGILLWALLAPIGAILCIGVRESVGLVHRLGVLTALSGAADFYLADSRDLPASRTFRWHHDGVLRAQLHLAVSTIVYLLLRLSIAEKRKMQNDSKKRTSLLQIEQERSEKLLLNILPGTVAERLKRTNKTIADGFADVTVMFADIVNFTQVAANMSPSQVFAMLNRIFSFRRTGRTIRAGKDQDHRRRLHGGRRTQRRRPTTPPPSPTWRWKCATCCATRPPVNGVHLEVRIGIGTGPIVAGVVGKKKFIYDLWGDTVNIASRITSEGVPGMIQCRHHDLPCACAGSFDFHEPQTIYLKGKGDMTVYRLIGRRERA